MKDKVRLNLIEKPGAAAFFTWIALAAAIFFGAYSVKIKGRLDKEVVKNNQILSRERELSYQLELASLKIKESATTLAWSNNEISRLRDRNDQIETKVTNIRKLLYSAVKKNKDTELAMVVPKIAQTQSELSEHEKKIEQDEFGEEVLFPEITEQIAISDKKIEELVNKSSALSLDVKLAGEVLTYNPSSKKVFINLGASNGGVEEGNRFAVWRNGKHVTDIRVAQVYSVTSTCEVVGPTLLGLRAGDVAEMVDVSAF